jgi:hypothetical protein
MHRDPSHEKVWLNRHQDLVSMEAQKNAFSRRKVAA